jgi:hypothetical protein
MFTDLHNHTDKEDDLGLDIEEMRKHSPDELHSIGQ